MDFRNYQEGQWKETEFQGFSARSARDEEDLAQFDRDVAAGYIKGERATWMRTWEGNLYKKIDGEWKRTLIGDQKITPYEIGSWK